MRLRKTLINLAVLFLTGVFLILCGEFILLFFPVYRGLNFMPIDVSNPVQRASPNQKVYISEHWNFQLPTKKRVNNAGFVNKSDYHYEHNTPLVAVVGDSYIAALMLSDDQPYYRLLADINPSLRVYSFGFDGAALSSYLGWAKYAHDNYKNDYLIINVCGNDFDESLKKYSGDSTLFYTYDRDQQGVLRLQKPNWQPNRFFKILGHFGLLRYAVHHLNFATVVQKILNKSRQSNSNDYVGNVAAYFDQNKEKETLEVIDAIFRDLPTYSGLSPERIMFVVDGLREGIYQQNLMSAHEKSYFGQMRKYFMGKAKMLGYKVVDAQPVFSQHYKVFNQHFEFVEQGDSHWNVVGHQVIAEAIQSSAWWQNQVRKSVA